MKSMRCRELGGSCDHELRASTWKEMVQQMTKHVMECHPDTANQMQNMHAADPERRGREMRPKWEAKASL